jgi:hypothetical protein
LLSHPPIAKSNFPTKQSVSHRQHPTSTRGCPAPDRSTTCRTGTSGSSSIVRTLRWARCCQKGTYKPRPARSANAHLPAGLGHGTHVHAHSHCAFVNRAGRRAFSVRQPRSTMVRGPVRLQLCVRLLPCRGGIVGSGCIHVTHSCVQSRLHHARALACARHR